MKAPARTERKEHAFREAAAWSAVGAGWLPLCGKFQELGFSVEWHDFECQQPLDWSRSFHPDSLELCFNLAGSGFIADPKQQVQLAANTFSFYRQGSPPLVAQRQPGQRHKFITIEFSKLFLQRHLSGQTANLHPLVRTLLDGDSQASQVAPADRLGSTLLALIDTLRHPPVFAPAHQLWFQCKALETAAQLFFHPPRGELFCTRQQRAARERVERARIILRQRMSDPPPLEELGRMVSCSPFYLSRLFSQEVGMTMQQYLRQIRMERAAELLSTGKCNVTEAAMEVGYNSLSHFSAAFHQTFGCCPGLYPLRTVKLDQKT